MNIYKLNEIKYCRLYGIAKISKPATTVKHKLCPTVKFNPKDLFRFKRIGLEQRN